VAGKSFLFVRGRVDSEFSAGDFMPSAKRNFLSFESGHKFRHTESWLGIRTSQIKDNSKIIWWAIEDLNLWFLPKTGGSIKN
jgi:hypothetical protein